MTIKLTKKTLALCVVVLALLIPATAYANHVFDDVADNRFFTEPVAWASANNITTGTSPSTFHPDRNVTRGENVTFLKRYDDNIVQPALAAIPPGPIAVGLLDYTGGLVEVVGTEGLSAVWDAPNERFVVTLDGVALSTSTHAVHVTPIRINGGAPTQDRSAATLFDSGSVFVTVYDVDAAGLVANDVHITVYEL